VSDEVLGGRADEAARLMKEHLILGRHFLLSAMSHPVFDLSFSGDAPCVG
jgi:hypothetical protein